MMAAFTGPEGASCVFWFEEVTKLATKVQSNFRTKYAKGPLSRPTIYEWHRCLVYTEFLCFKQEENVRFLFSQERTINRLKYHYLLQQFLMPQIDENDRYEMFISCNMVYHRTI